MTDLTPGVLVEAIGDAGLQCSRYSGRGMRGEECVAVRLESGGSGALADIVRSLGALDLPGAETADLAAEIVKRVRTDRLGLGSVLYWPSVAWEEPEDDGMDGQDRENRTDDQDRESYTADGED